MTLAEQVERGLGHTFASRTLLTQALTHRSFSATHNERLEFLGDAVLDCIASDLLFERFADLPEGVLSRLRANLVKQDTLAAMATELDLGSALRLGDGEVKTGGRTRPSILADALEALIGAVFMESGYPAARVVVARLFGDRLTRLDPRADARDPKTALQEWLQARHAALPVYEISAVTGEAHAQAFRARCRVDAVGISTEGEGSNRRHAEQAAAARALEQLQGQA
ncbi:MAG: ribonuclease III [Gammaproteobacteria bacterium]|nr:ribonuclease III [Gammaproteobacteria bacterium]MBU0773100.1 ribonuclease III [Gammaproteobacteria bacterium]MBU0855738.1 ribonuclease III [Gammaproteobacteria bacterium]MBU1846993.1 ribonuclease III [Gammaproteobacteria bacterium]